MEVRMATRSLIVIAALGALSLSLAGLAIAQDHGGGGAFYGNGGIASTGGDQTGPQSGSEPPTHGLRTRHQREAMASAAQGYKLACAPDRASLCQGKSGDRALECIDYYRLKLSSPCKSALTQLQLAQAGAL
jgi:hypothetical protein